MKWLRTTRFECLVSASTLVLGMGCDFAGNADMGGRANAGGNRAADASSVGATGIGGSSDGLGGAPQPTNRSGRGGAGAVSAGGAVSLGGAVGLGGGVSLGGATAGDPSPTPCYIKVSVGPDVLDSLSGGTQSPLYLWSGDGFVGVASGTNGLGYRVQRLASNGAVQGAAVTLWSETKAGSTLDAAASGDALAIVESIEETANNRPICRLAMARLPEVSPVLAPFRISDEPAGDTILNEARRCQVAATADGFMATWQQSTSATSDVSTLFAQAFDRDGNPVGERLAIASGDKSVGLYTLSSDGNRAILTATSGKDAQTNLVLIENGAMRFTPLDTGVLGASQAVTLAPVPAGFLARTSQNVSVLDRDGRLTQGPIEVDSAKLVAPVGSNHYVVVSRDEYLTAHSLDASLSNPSAPTALSQDRSSSAVQLVAAPDASVVGLVFNDAGKTRFAKLECTDTPPSSVGPKVCPESAEVTPKDDGCTDPVCHTMVRLDYLTLAPRGWAVVGGPLNPVDKAAANTAAAAVFAEHGEYLSSPAEISGPTAGLFTAYISPSDFGAVALVGEASGLVVASGGVVWAGTGHWWVPTAWNDPKDLACATTGFEAEETYVDPGTCSSYYGEVEHATASEALDLVLRSNLAAHAQSQGAFSAFVYLYTPTLGACSPENAEYLVVLTRKQ